MGALVPYVLQNSITVATKRIMPKGSHLSPAKGVKRMFGHMALFEFGKSLVKMIAIGLTCWAVLHPLFADSVGLVSSDPASLLGHVRDALVAVLMAEQPLFCKFPRGVSFGSIAQASMVR
jgi:flagellar biosynthetic protein FlhB